MVWRYLGVLVTVLSVAILLSGCGYTVKWNQKMTVEVEIDGEKHSGSSVAQLRISHPGKFWSQIQGGHYNAELSGEAVVVDMGEHGRLFALWSDSPGNYIYLAETITNYQFENLNIDSRTRRGLKRIKKARAKGEIGSSMYPMVVGLPDKDDPESLRIIRGNNQYNLQKIYGDATKMEVWFEITKEPVTVGKVKKAFSEKYRKKMMKIWENYEQRGRTDIPLAIKVRWSYNMKKYREQEKAK